VGGLLIQEASLAKVLMHGSKRPPGTHASMPRMSRRERFSLVALERARGGLPRDRISRHFLARGGRLFRGVDEEKITEAKTGSGQTQLVAGWVKRPCLKRGLSPQQINNMSDLVKNPKICAACGKPGCELHCTCKFAFYCDAVCQKRDWPRHKLECPVALARAIGKAKKKARERAEDNEGNLPRDLAQISANVHVAGAQYEAGKVLAVKGRLADAERCLLDARHKFSEAIIGPGTGDMVRPLIAEINLLLSDTYLLMGRFDEAHNVADEAKKIYTNTNGERSKGVAQALLCSGDNLIGQGKHMGGLSRLEEAHSIFKETIGEENHHVGRLLCAKGRSYVQSGRHDKAISPLLEALHILRKVHGDDSLEVACCLNNLGTPLRKTGSLSEARAKHEEALGIFRRVQGEKHENVASAFNNIALVLGEQGEIKEAAKAFKKSIKVYRRAHGDDHVQVALGLKQLGVLYGRHGQNEVALEALKEALAILTKAMGPENEEVALAHHQIAAVTGNSGDPQTGIKSARESIRVYRKLGLAHGEVSGLLRDLEAQAEAQAAGPRFFIVVDNSFTTSAD
jgi:tetratricopeptide (TPR) repeat protein